ncbi:hypothetical protein KIW84_034432, partial [Lathyrus oleraceus]
LCYIWHVIYPFLFLTFHCMLNFLHFIGFYSVMSRPPIFIKALVKGNQVWKMHIRVVGLWVIKEKSGLQHIEMVIQDGKGDQIQVTTRNRGFKDWIEQLTEHEKYCLYNGELMVNDNKLKTCLQ